MLRLKDQPLSERPRERLRTEGPDALSNAELLAILLRTGMQGRNVVEVAQEMMRNFGSLQALGTATVEDLRKVKGVGPDKAVTLVAAFALARKLAQELHTEAPLLDNPAAVADLMRESTRLLEVETFHAVLLNTRRRLIRVCEISQGTLDTLLVHPREVFHPAINGRASAIILVHNHPSGDPTPSEADIKVTRDLIRGGQILKIDVLDHVIMGRGKRESGNDYVSLKELGYFY